MTPIRYDDHRLISLRVPRVVAELLCGPEEPPEPPYRIERQGGDTLDEGERWLRGKLTEIRDIADREALVRKWWRFRWMFDERWFTDEP